MDIHTSSPYELKKIVSADSLCIDSHLFYEQLGPDNLTNVMRVSDFLWEVCNAQKGKGSISGPILVAYGSFCRRAAGIEARRGHTYLNPRDIDMGLLLQSNLIGEPPYTEKLVRRSLTEKTHELGITSIEISPRCESGGPNSFKLKFESGLPIDMTAPMRTRIDPRMRSTSPPVNNVPWLYDEWTEFQCSRGWPWTVLWKMSPLLGSESIQVSISL